MGLTEIQKQTIAQRDGISIRYSFIGQTKNQTYAYVTFIKKVMFTQLKFLIFGSVVLLCHLCTSFFWPAILRSITGNAKKRNTFFGLCV
jgi:hypothetical protein